MQPLLRAALLFAGSCYLATAASTTAEENFEESSRNIEEASCFSVFSLSDKPDRQNGFLLELSKISQKQVLHDLVRELKKDGGKTLEVSDIEALRAELERLMEGLLVTTPEKTSSSQKLDVNPGSSAGSAGSGADTGADVDDHTAGAGTADMSSGAEKAASSAAVDVREKQELAEFVAKLTHFLKPAGEKSPKHRGLGEDGGDKVRLLHYKIRVKY